MADKVSPEDKRSAEELRKRDSMQHPAEDILVQDIGDLRGYTDIDPGAEPAEAEAEAEPVRKLSAAEPAS